MRKGKLTIYPDGNNGAGRPLATVLDQSDNDAPYSLDGRPLSEIVHQLWTLNRDWDRVLSEEDKGMVEVDEEPATEKQRFAKIVSIVPNWVEFGFKALQLAKIWWTTANRIYGRELSSDDEARNEGGAVHTPHPGDVEDGAVQPPHPKDVEGGIAQPPHPEDVEDDDEDDEIASLEEEVATLSDCAYQISVEMDSLRDELKQVRG